MKKKFVTHFSECADLSAKETKKNKQIRLKAGAEFLKFVNSLLDSSILRIFQTTPEVNTAPPV